MLRRRSSPFAALPIGALAAVLPACTAHPGAPDPRAGDEIMVCGRLFHTGGAPVVLWTDPGGYDAYRTEQRFAPLDKSAWTPPPPGKAGAGSGGSAGEPDVATPNRYGLRRGNLSADDLERVRGGGWDLPTLQRVVDQFVIHYDAVGTSRQCFKTLHDSR